MAKTRGCPVCGTHVKPENLPEHFGRVHPKERIEKYLSEEELKSLVHRKRRPRVAISSKEKAVYVGVAIVVVAIVLFATFYQPQNAGLGVGQEAPDFTLMDTKGSTVRLRDHTGHVVLLDFMDVDCSFCQAQTGEMLVPLYSQFSGRVVFLSVDVNFVGSPDDNSRIEEFKTQYSAEWSHMLDTVGIYKQYGVTATPKTFILDEENKISYSHDGYRTGDITIFTQKLNEALST